MNNKYPLALPEGTILAGQYVIEKALGQGGFGITYKARDHKTGNTVAVKEFFPETLATRTQCTVVPFDGERGENYEYGKTCFLQEAETLAQFIGNENIVKIYSYFEEYGTAYFVMEFIEGINFDEYIKQRGGRVSYEEAENVLIKIIDALSIVHSKGIVHRDVTPDNIYITNDGTVKLLDFGAARYSIGDKSRSLDVVLKHGFAPKEQYTRHGKQGPFTDVYTVGASFYFGLTGKRPPDSIDRIETDDLIPPSNLGIAIPKHKEDAILKALSVQPADRFQTMAQFKSALCGETVVGAVPVMGTGEIQQRVFTEQNAQPVQPVQSVPVMAPVTPNSQWNGSNQTPNMSSNGKKSKAKLYVGLGVVAFICILAAILVPTLLRGKDDNQETTAEKGYTYAEEETTKENVTTQKPTEKPTQKPTQKPTTTQPTTTKKEEPTTTKPTTSYSYGSTDTSTNNNISCGGFFDRSTGDLLSACLFFNDSLQIVKNNNENYKAIDNGNINSMILLKNQLVYLKEGKAYLYQNDKIEEFYCLKGYNCSSLYNTANGIFFVYKEDERYSLGYEDKKTAEVSPYVYEVQSSELVTFVGGKIYLVYNNHLQSAELEELYTGGTATTLLDLSDKGEIINMVAENNFIYILSYVATESKAIVTKYNISTNSIEYTWGLNGFDEEVPIKINVYNNVVYITEYNYTDSSIAVHRKEIIKDGEYKCIYTKKGYSTYQGVCLDKDSCIYIRAYDLKNKKNVTIRLVKQSDGTYKELID